MTLPVQESNLGKFLAHPVVVFLEYIILYYLGRYLAVPLYFEGSLGVEFIAFLGGLVLFFVLITINKYSRKDLGLMPFLEKSHLPPYTLITILIIFLMIVWGILLPNPSLKESVSISFIVIFSLVGGLCQEVMFRAYLVRRLQNLSDNHIHLILLVSLAFAWWHTPHHIFYLTSGSFILSIIWTWLYLRYKSLILVSLSHAAVDFVLLFLFVYL